MMMNGTNTLPPAFDVNNRRKKKFTGGNASKRHRDRVNVEFNNLAQLLPFPESVIAKLDKSSILRLAVSYIRAKSFFKGASVHALRRETLCSLIKEGTGVVTEIFSKALDGFLLVLTEDMKVLFVSESVRDYLGYCQAGIIHESFLQFVNPADHSIAQASVNYRKDEDDISRNIESRTQDYDDIKGQPTVRRRFTCRMKCAYSCSSRFYTAYRTFEFSGHLRTSSIQDGKEQKDLNTLVVFATPMSNNKQDGSDSSEKSDVKDHVYQPSLSGRKDYVPYETYANGFRIEPTLRPHVAPIPVTSKEQNELRAYNDAPFRHRLTRPPPSLINVSETYPPPAHDLPRLLKRESISVAATFTNKLSTFNDMFTSESRFSDHSDDGSKCSPVSSPNLSWKQQRDASPGFTVNSEYTAKHEHHFTRPVLPVSNYKWMSRSPELETRPCSRDSLNSLDAYSRGNVLTSNRDRNTGSISPPFSYLPDMLHKKRYYTDEYTTEDISVRYKKQKLETVGKKNKFNISSILGLEEDQAPANLHSRAADERSQLVYDVYR